MLPVLRIRKSATQQLRLYDLIIATQGEGTGNPLQYSHLENPMDRGAW